MNKTDRITILGITGYMGAWLAKDLSDQGFTNIVGTYLDQNKADFLKKELPSIEFIKGDLLSDLSAIKKAIAGSQWVFNDTAPFSGKEKTVADFVKTKEKAVDNLFRAIADAGTVKKLLQIGSAGAVGYGSTDPDKKIVTEDDWTDVEDMDYPYEPFAVMKTAEEKRIRYLADIIGLDFTVLHPTNVIGPSFTHWQHDMIYAYLFDGKYLVDGPMDSVDVRDLAKLEIALMENPAADSKRVLGLGFTTSFKELVEIVKDHLTEQQQVKLFKHLPQIVPADLALALWQPIDYTSFYKDQALRLVNKAPYQTKYPDFYDYQFTDAKKTIEAAVDKMLSDL
ncbi:NAD-dependent epimerase/dehydratase family protein [Oenococcus alcoholitolerans]|uniref:NAD-dependent epimerase/dehydratase family protein n=1 Tax=Oenococcus alcoholitolerans TaxID=931074 RepID=UPI003F72DE84